jgi:hypothetical protein
LEHRQITVGFGIDRCATDIDCRSEKTPHPIMAKIELNERVAGIRGKIDGWVYRNLHGQIVVHAYRPAKRSRSSSAQVGARNRFRDAQAYAADVLSHPLRRALYLKLSAARKCPVNALLVSNFLTPPTIEAVELGGYHGQAGGTIDLLVTDPVEVVDVALRIRTIDGTEVESGAATKQNGIWLYRATDSVPRGREWELEITARNPAGAVVVRQVRPPTTVTPAR